MLPLLLQEYRRPIVTVDIDVRLTERFGELLPTSPAFDFGCFETTRREPSSVYIAILMIMVPTAACLDFLAALNGFCLYGLKLSVNSSWLLDQSALYSVKHYFAVTRPDFRFEVMNGPTGADVMNFLALVTTDEEKFEMRSVVSTPRRKD